MKIWVSMQALPQSFWVKQVDIRDPQWQRAADRCCRATIRRAWINQIISGIRPGDHPDIRPLLLRVAALFERERWRAKATLQLLPPLIDQDVTRGMALEPLRLVREGTGTVYPALPE